MAPTRGHLRVRFVWGPDLPWYQDPLHECQMLEPAEHGEYERFALHLEQPSTKALVSRMAMASGALRWCSRACSAPPSASPGRPAAASLRSAVAARASVSAPMRPRTSGGQASSSAECTTRLCAVSRGTPAAHCSRRAARTTFAGCFRSRRTAAVRPFLVATKGFDRKQATVRPFLVEHTRPHHQQPLLFDTRTHHQQPLLFDIARPFLVAHGHSSLHILAPCISNPCLSTLLARGVARTGATLQCAASVDQHRLREVQCYNVLYLQQPLLINTASERTMARLLTLVPRCSPIPPHTERKQRKQESALLPAKS